MTPIISTTPRRCGLRLLQAFPFNACEFQSKGDAITDLHEDLAAEQKARTTYDNLIRIIENPEVREPLKFLRAREVVHFQRFGEALEKDKVQAG